MVPERRMVDKIKLYDKDLFVKWNKRSQFFEVWRQRVIGAELVTPVTYSIYYEGSPRVFCPLDERILTWLSLADLQNKKGNAKLELLLRDNRFKEMEIIKTRKRLSEFRDRSKDAYSLLTNRFVASHTKKNNRLPSFNTKAKKQSWVRPDLVGKTSPRVFMRSKNNTKRYFDGNSN